MDILAICNSIISKYQSTHGPSALKTVPRAPVKLRENFFRGGGEEYPKEKI